MSIVPVASYVPGKIARVGQGAASLGIKLPSKDQALAQIVDFVIRKAVPNLHPELKVHVQKYLTQAANHLLKAGQSVNTKVLLSHAKRGLPSFLENLKMTVGRRINTGENQGSTIQLGGGAILGGSTTSAPVAISHNISRRSKPRMSVKGDSYVVRHSEMLGAILSGAPTSNITAYRSVGFRANPGISTIFPWLSSMAVNYEKYRFRRLTFSIVPLVSTAFSGRIGVGFDYDSSDVAPGNRQEFYALTTHAESMPWQACSINVKVDNIFRFTGTHVAADNKLIDLGQVVIMSDSISNGTISSAIPLYDLIVDYEVELIEPQQALFSTQAFSNVSTLVSGVPLGTGVDTTSIVGPSIVTSTAVSSTVITVELPAGTYTFATRHNWSAGVATYSVASPTSTATLKVNTFAGGSFAACVGTIAGISDMKITFTVGTVTYTTNMNACNLLFTRVSSGVAANYLA